ncbi:hypothetical protein TTHERM_00554490 (macronuclear) [Tetrahymena thermophila SB210]|uniref:Uncharacterized protein n=1 Tax=Tetrahymena thermophila (strain SB210) TaxID=312017 RepID=Q22UH6_TETTS|nr:hypothetical protein TTHERM_00554490 [Tetrahymena thermophila SB210]EAR88994.1 hypothetical protein TTHERM_00554490 [Tetrahymena thermophila SB210]|eukprot:XP_001009239.1 hypothetical protein TTHERM_00554490 [Tetrahymena thermophila SB210]
MDEGQFIQLGDYLIKQMEMIMIIQKGQNNEQITFLQMINTQFQSQAQENQLDYKKICIKYWLKKIQQTVNKKERVISFQREGLHILKKELKYYQDPLQYPIPEKFRDDLTQKRLASYYLLLGCTSINRKINKKNSEKSYTYVFNRQNKNSGCCNVKLLIFYLLSSIRKMFTGQDL